MEMENTMTAPNPIRSRTRPAGATATATAAAAAAPNLLHIGADAEAARAREAQRQEDRQNKVWAPYRFKVDRGGVGEFIILDSDIDLCPVFYEHAITEPMDNGRRRVTGHEMCVKELEHCPVCEREKESYYVQMISVMDIMGYTNTRTGVVVPHTKRMLAVKYQQQGFFRRLCKEQMQGNMRGAHIVCHRDDSQMSPAIGTPSSAIGTDGTILRYGEEQLLAAYGHEQVMNRDGTRVIKVPNEDCYPYDYNKIFPGTTAEELRRKYGGVAPAGSPGEAEAAFAAAAPAGVAPAPAAAAAPAPAGTRAATPEEIAAAAAVVAAAAAAAAGPTAEELAAAAAIVAAGAAAAAPAPAAPAPAAATAGIQRQTAHAAPAAAATAESGEYLDDEIPF